MPVSPDVLDARMRYTRLHRAQDHATPQQIEAARRELERLKAMSRAERAITKALPLVGDEGRKRLAALLT